jgi:putative ABC transport system permease protein
MFDLDRLDEIWVTITRNKVRSILTGFGVFWGIFMLIFMMGFGEALQKGMYKGIEGVATNSTFMMTNRTAEPYKGFNRGRFWSMRNRDVDVLLHSVPEIDVLSPVLFRWGSNVVFGENTATYNARGVAPNYAQVENPFLSYGRYINEIDMLQRRKVCVIGTKIYEELFPTKENPLGEYIQINGIYFQVVGVADGIPQFWLGGRMAESIAMPFTTMQQILNQGDVIHVIAATVKPGFSAKMLEEKMKEIIKANNSIAPTDQQAIYSWNLEEEFKKFQFLFLGIAILIWIVGSGTLIAGIVGVSNIMLVTVKERTKEIGIRRALGAKPIVIISQIMSESLLLTAIAGMLGLCLAVLCLYFADVYWLQNTENMFLSDPGVSFGTAIASTIILLICGLIAGAIPTIRALQVKAIDAIREE